MKLQTKIRLFSSIFMLLLILLINTAIYFLFYKITVNSELDELRDQTNSIVTALNENPEVFEKDLLRAYLPNDGMIRVISKDVKLIHQLTKKSKYISLDYVYTTKETKEINTSFAPEDVAVIHKPIIWENGEIVTLQVSKHLVALSENMRTLFYVLVVASFLMLLPTIIAGRVLSTFLLQPIKELIVTMRENMETKKWKKINLKIRSRDELYEMGATFNQMIDQLEDNFRKQEIFVSDASHELKTPISIIKSYAQLLKRRGLEKPELFPEAIEAIESEANRMQKLVEQMLLLANNETEFIKEKIDFIQLCQETIKKLRDVYEREIVIDYHDNELYVYGNKDQLQQIIYILVNNALKYSDREIELYLDQDNKYIIFKAKDYGQGIPEHEQERIFDRFYRVDKARSRETGGTGLGLPIAKTIVHAHHGQLFVESKVGEGSIFTLQLPKIK